MFVAQKMCLAWQGGVFTVDGTTFDFFEKLLHLDWVGTNVDLNCSYCRVKDELFQEGQQQSVQEYTEGPSSLELRLGTCCGTGNKYLGRYQWQGQVLRGLEYGLK